MEIINKKVAIVGLGVVGEASIKYLLKNGAKVVVHDKKNTAEIKEKIKLITMGKKYQISTVLGDDYLSEIHNMEYDFVVLTPGINPNQPEIERLKELGIPIHNDITLFLEEWALREPTIGITGSNGKSTTATIIHKLLTKNGLLAELGGNIGISPLNWLNNNIKSDTTPVIEVSSFLLEQFTDEYFFDIFVFTNISENHLDRYPLGINQYLQTKLRGINREKTTLIINIDEIDIYKKVLKLSEVKHVLPVSMHKINKDKRGVFLNEDKSVTYQDGNGNSKILLNDISARKIIGEHNAYNILFALASVVPFPLSTSTNDKVIKNSKGLPHRTEFVAKINEVTYINDSKSTSPDATKKALSAAIGKNTVLIAGGVDKESGFETLKNEFEKYVHTLVLLPGTASLKIEAVAHEVVPNIISVNNMKKAVLAAKMEAKEGDTVLLSPSASSFNLFRNFEDRGEQFIAEVSKL